MPLPPLTAEQRANALTRAVQVRHERAEVKNRLRKGTLTIAHVFESAALPEDGGVLGKMRVTTLLESLPGIGPIGARRIMQQIGIAESRRVRGLGEHQRAALEREFAPAGA